MIQTRGYGESDEKIEELTKTVSNALETAGVLGKIKASLRASVFDVLQGKEGEGIFNVNPQIKRIESNPREHLLAELVRDYLRFYDLSFTQSTFVSEAALDENELTPNEISTELQNEGSKKGLSLNNDKPLLLQLLDDYLLGGGSSVETRKETPVAAEVSTSLEIPQKRDDYDFPPPKSNSPVDEDPTSTLTLEIEPPNSFEEDTLFDDMGLGAGSSGVDSVDSDTLLDSTESPRSSLDVEAQDSPRKLKSLKPMKPLGMKPIASIEGEKKKKKKKKKKRKKKKKKKKKGASSPTEPVEEKKNDPLSSFAQKDPLNLTAAPEVGLKPREEPKPKSLLGNLPETTKEQQPPIEEDLPEEPKQETEEFDDKITDEDMFGLGGDDDFNMGDMDGMNFEMSEDFNAGDLSLDGDDFGDDFEADALGDDDLGLGDDDFGTLDSDLLDEPLDGKIDLKGRTDEF